MPTFYFPRYKKVHIAQPKKFPYNFHFFIDEVIETVVIIAIIHDKRESKFAMKRV